MKYLASKHTIAYTVFKLGRRRNGGNDFYIINEPGFILILIESVLSSFALGSFILSFSAIVFTQMLHVKYMHCIHSQNHAFSRCTHARMLKSLKLLFFVALFLYTIGQEISHQCELVGLHGRWKVKEVSGRGRRGWDQRLWKWVVGLNVVRVQADAQGNPVGINDVLKAEYAMQNKRVSKSHWEA